MGALIQRVDNLEKKIGETGGNTGGNSEGKGDKIMGFVPVKEMMPKVYGGRIEEWRN